MENGEKKITLTHLLISQAGKLAWTSSTLSHELRSVITQSSEPEVKKQSYLLGLQISRWASWGKMIHLSEIGSPARPGSKVSCVGDPVHSLAHSRGFVSGDNPGVPSGAKQPALRLSSCVVLASYSTPLCLSHHQLHETRKSPDSRGCREDSLS